jgi:eukaryotic-like serine/threonine-protein kinase
VESGQLIAGRYRLRERLGHGGMSVVWRADDDVLGREVAVKVLSPALAGDPAQRRLIGDEARAAARLRHPNVIAVYDFGEFTEAGRTLAYIVMELGDGRTLAEMLTGGALPWKVAVLVGAQVAAALAAAHADGIVHRDVKPANVMVTSSGVKLVDFGISAAVGALDGQDGQVLGTPAYLAPERIEGGPVRPATDVYALGLLLYLALAGKMPWQASTVTQMVKAHVYAKPAALPPIPGLPTSVVRLVSRCLAKRAADRPSAIAVAEALGELAGLPSMSLLRSVAAPTVAIGPVDTRRTNAAVVGVAARTVAAVRTRPGRAGLVAAGVAAAVMTAGGAWWAGTRPSTPAEAAAYPAAAPSSSATRPASSGAARPLSSAGPASPTAATTAPSRAATRVVTVAVTRQQQSAKRSKAGPAHPPKPRPGPPAAAKPKPPKKPGK